MKATWPYTEGGKIGTRSQGYIKVDELEMLGVKHWQIAGKTVVDAK